MMKASFFEIKHLLELLVGREYRLKRAVSISVVNLGRVSSKMLRGSREYGQDLT